MIQRPAWLIALATGALALGLAACAPRGGPSPRPAPPPTPTPLRVALEDHALHVNRSDAPLREVRPWRHGLAPPGAEAGVVYMALEKGYFLQAGLAVEYVPLAADARLASVAAGPLDTVSTDGPGAVQAIAHGAPLRIVASDRPRSPQGLLARKEVRELRDLYGRRVALGPPGKLVAAQLAGLFDKYGLDFGRVEAVSVGGASDGVQAVVAGKVAAAVAPPELARALEPDAAQVLLSVGRELPDLLRLVLVARQEVIEGRPDELTAFLVAYARGVRYALQHKDEAVELAVRLGGVDPDDAAWVYDRFVAEGLVSPNLAVSEAALRFTQEMSVRLQNQEQALPLDRLADLDYQQRALRALGGDTRLGP